MKENYRVIVTLGTSSVVINEGRCLLFRLGVVTVDNKVSKL